MKSICVLVFIVYVATLSALADIQVSYTGYSAEQQTAFEQSVSLWEPVLNSTVPIKINARQQIVPGFVSIVIPNLIYNFAGAPQTNLWYPTALANALSGSELNPGEADIDIIINPNQNWYLGAEANCPANQIDYISEVHKGLSYGLGYMSSFYVTSGMGTYGMLDPSVLGLSTSFPWENMQGQPTLYDTHVLNSGGLYLTDPGNFSNPSAALMLQLTGGQLRWQGTWADMYAGNTQAVLYAGTYNLARTARLEAGTYLGTENAPGIPTAYNGSCYRYPAPIVLGMLRDMGWTLDLVSLLAAPQGLSAYAEYQNVILSWNPPQTEYDVLNYQVYRNGSLVGNANTSSYNDIGVPWGTHTYSVMAVYRLGESEASEEVSVVVGSPNADPGMLPPVQLSVRAHPNPFHETLWLDVQNRNGSYLHLAVYDLRGRLVRELFEGACATNLQSVWDGKDERGNPCTPGIYFVRVSDGCSTKLLKILRTK